MLLTTSTTKRVFSSLRANSPLNWSNSSIYDMALLSYLIAFGHFTSEICIFRTAKINLPVLSPVIVSSTYFLNCSFEKLIGTHSYITYLDVKTV